MKNCGFYSININYLPGLVDDPDNYSTPLAR